MSRFFDFMMVVVLLSLLFGCGGSGNSTIVDLSTIVVNSLLDTESPESGEITLRVAVELIEDGGTISFAPALDGEMISLSIVGEEHAILKGEVMGFDYVNNISYLVGYFERDYGKSALYARKSFTVDASALTDGITLTWAGTDDARVLAVYGDLTLNNVSIAGGHSVAEAIETYDPEAAPGAENSQPWTLGRGGALAVWGAANLVNCTLYDNHCLGDFEQSRDRGAFGGGVYADIIHLTDCIVSGNTVTGGGAAGGGVYSVGGAESTSSVSTIVQSSITGNRISGLFTYGGGVYSDGGGIGKRKTLSITNSTIARNLVEPAPTLPPFFLSMGYWRGGGVYMSNGYLTLQSCTIVENEVYGLPRTDGATKPNLAGGIAATIGDAHAVESMTIQQSLIAGNIVYEIDTVGSIENSYSQDIFTGSLLHFYSYGYNLIGQINFAHMLAPIPQWESLSRKHWPVAGDTSDVVIGDILAAAISHDVILSAGVDEGHPAVLYYPPAGTALDRVPDAGYSVVYTLAEVDGFRYSVPESIDGFLSSVLSRLETQYGLTNLATDFTTDFEAYLAAVDTDEETLSLQPYTDLDGEAILTLAETLWFGPAETWPSEDANQAWIDFWQLLDVEIGDELGMEKIGDEFWGDFIYEAGTSGLELTSRQVVPLVGKSELDQLGLQRLGFGDIGAIELRP